MSGACRDARRRRRRARYVVLGIVAMLLLAGCHIDVAVDADVNVDGTGTVKVAVVFDAAAAAALGDVGGIDAAIDAGALAQVGWVVSSPMALADGAVEISATKQVTSADGWQAVLDEIAGPGVFTDVELTGTDGTSERQRTLSFNVDVSRGPSIVFDPATTTLLNGEPLGVPLRQATAGRPADEAVSMVMRASVASDSDQRMSGEWRPRFNQGEPLMASVVSTSTTSRPVILRWVAGSLASLAVLAAILAVVRTVLERRSSVLHQAPAIAIPAGTFDTGSGEVHATAPAAASAQGPFAAALQPEEGDSAAQEPVRLVIVDPLTVLFQQSKPPEHYLLSYVRHNKGTAPDERILAAHRELVIGAIDTVAFWQACGVDGAATVIDDVYCEMRWLRAGARDFLAEFAERRIPVVALTNDSAAWSTSVRTRDHLTAVWPWVISSEQGMLKPDPGIFDLLGRMVNVPWSQCLYIDTDPGSLAVAQALGMRTTFFDPDYKGADAALGHPRVANFDGFFRRQLS